MHIFITGGTGLIGSLLVPTLLDRGDTVTLYTRSSNVARLKFGDSVKACTDLDALPSLDGFDGVVNLAGEPIAPGRWTAEKKEHIAKSRKDITRKLTMLILAGKTPPSVFVSGSAVGYYGNQGATWLTEASLPKTDPKTDFLPQVCKEWEQAALGAASERTRVCISRTGIVLSSLGGMLGALLPLFRYGLGAVAGSGEQYISWVHRRDMVDMLCFLLKTEAASGVFNLTAPAPATNRELSHSLAQALHRPCLLRIPAFVARLALGEAATLLLEGQRVSPHNITALGYQFACPELPGALEQIVGLGG